MDVSTANHRRNVHERQSVWLLFPQRFDESISSRTGFHGFHDTKEGTIWEPLIIDIMVRLHLHASSESVILHAPTLELFRREVIPVLSCGCTSRRVNANDGTSFVKSVDHRYTLQHGFRLFILAVRVRAQRPVKVKTDNLVFPKVLHSVLTFLSFFAIGTSEGNTTFSPVPSIDSMFRMPETNSFTFSMLAA